MPEKPTPSLTGNPVADISDLLDAAGIPYVFTGSLAYSAWAAPRSTKDVDVVIYAPGRVALALFLNRLAEVGLAVDPPAALRELDALKLTVVPMPVTGAGTFPVELILPKVPAVDAQVLQRSLMVPYPGRPQGIRVASPEDYVLFKLIFFRERDRLDIKDVLASHPDLDVGYVAISLSQVFPDSDERARWFRKLVGPQG